MLLAVLAGVMLIFVAVRIAQSARLVGGNVATLEREAQAGDYVAPLNTLLNTAAVYRTAMILGDRSQPVARARVDAAMGQVSKVNDRSGSSLGVAISWRAIVLDWAHVRALKNPTLQRLRLFARAITDFYGTLEENSGLTYDPDVSAQNLADLVYDTVPSTVSSVYYGRLLTKRFIRSRHLSLRDRLALNDLSRVIASDVDLTKDDLKHTFEPNAAAALDPITRGSALATRFNNSVLKGEVLADVPSYTEHAIDSKTLPGIAALNLGGAHAANLLDRNIARRLQLEASRRRSIPLALILGVLFLSGLAAELMRLMARRDRVALRRAQQESARLQAELARELTEKTLRMTEAQFRAIFDGASLGIAILDQRGALVDANAVFREHFDRDATLFLSGHEEEVQRVLSGESTLFEFEQHYDRPSGDDLWVNATISQVNDEAGHALFAMCMFRDVTQLKHTERRIVHDMTHDSLTGLPNRALFETQLRERFAESTTLLDSFFAVIYVDLDNFKDFNESLGHAAGDAVLRAVSTRLRASLDPSDVVARLGSDEFAILIRSLADILHVESVARRILNNVGKPITIGDRAVFAACSVGIAIGSATYERAEDVMRDADTAMYQAKSTGGSRFAVFDSNMHARAERRLQLTTDLRLALQRNEFRLLYQPIVRIADGILTGCEALIRWDHPAEGVISPNDFMPIAEQTGLAVPVGRFVFETAIRQLAKWRLNWIGEDVSPFSMSVNISGAEIFDEDFETFVVSTCAESQIDPREVTLEITESIILDSSTRANLIFERLKSRGFKICIDDFGTGYSSLRYLQQFKIDGLKIDRSFVASSDGEVASEPIVRTLMTLAEAFDLHVVAEGVESQRQRDMLRQAGCRYAQGFFYARPLSPAELANMFPDVLARTSRLPQNPLSNVQ